MCPDEQTGNENNPPGSQACARRSPATPHRFQILPSEMSHRNIREETPEFQPAVRRDKPRSSRSAPGRDRIGRALCSESAEPPAGMECAYRFRPRRNTNHDMHRRVRRLVTDPMTAAYLGAGRDRKRRIPAQGISITPAAGWAVSLWPACRQFHATAPPGASSEQAPDLAPLAALP